MASGLYSQHVNNKKMLYLRNTIIILMLVTLAVCCLFPLFYMIVNSCGRGCLLQPLGVPDVLESGFLQGVLLFQ